MINNEIAVPISLKVPDNFKYVPFVSSSEQTDSTASIKKDKRTTNYSLTGAEARQFYNDVVSTPPRLSSPPVLSCENESKSKIVSNINLLNSSRLTIFHQAQNGSVEGIEYCLSKNCSVDEQDMYGWTPLMCATFEGHYAVVEFLIEKGANADIKSRQGLTALDIAMSKKNKALIKLLKTGIIIETVSSERQKSKETQFCNFCKCSYDESPERHERSIAHLLTSNNNASSSTYYHIPESNKGFQIMLKKGWDKNTGLGPNASGRKFPVKTVLKTDRMCIGNQKSKPKITHFGPNDCRSVKNSNQPSLNLKREQKLKKKAAKKLEYKNRQLEIEFRRQFHVD